MEDLVNDILEDESSSEYDPIKDLWRESDNYDFPSPLTLFLDLIGYSVSEYGENFTTLEKVQDRLGYHELGLLGEALVLYSDKPTGSLLLIEKLVEADHVIN
jgi:hypothetical protein